MRLILDYSMSNLYLHQVMSIVTTLTSICVANKQYLVLFQQLKYAGLLSALQILHSLDLSVIWETLCCENGVQ